MVDASTVAALIATDDAAGCSSRLADSVRESSIGEDWHEIGVVVGSRMASATGGDSVDRAWCCCCLCYRAQIVNDVEEAGSKSDDDI